MSPEQRAMVEKMMGSKTPSGGASNYKPPELTRTVRTEHVGTYTCQVWEGKRAGVKVIEHCIVPYSKITGGSQLVEVLGRLSDLMQQVSSGLQSSTLSKVRDEFEGYKQLDGYPVLSRTFSDGKVQHERVLKSVRNSAVASSAFDVPDDYTKQDLLKRS